MTLSTLLPQADQPSNHPAEGPAAAAAATGAISGATAPPAGRRPDPVEELTSLRVVPWSDPVVDNLGHDPRSWYVETFWLGILGPSTTWFLRLVAAEFDHAPDGFDLDLALTAGCLGLGVRRGRHSPFRRTLDRCAMFEMARPAGAGGLAVRRMLPPLARRHLIRLPTALQERHRAWTEERQQVPQVELLRRRCRRLALSLVELGEDPDAIELQLVRWRFHPALAHESARWALARASSRA